MQIIFKKDLILKWLFFGSQIANKQRKTSDWYIGIYFKPEHEMLEWESKHEYSEKNKIWSDIENIVKTEVDLIVLNSAPSTLVFDILRKGKLLNLKNKNTCINLLQRSSYEASDFLMPLVYSNAKILQN